MNLQIFQEKIEGHFNLAEIKNLCFQLGIEYENLPGSTRNEKSRELVEHCDRHGCLPDLLEKCRELRPHLPWQEVAEHTQQLSPQIREDKLAFLCWVYIKSNGNTLQPVQSDDMASAMDLEPQEIMRTALFLNQKSLVKFDSLIIGTKITHHGIVKAEYDIVQAGFLLENFPPNIVTKIKGIKKKRWEYLRCLYMKSKDISFKSISGIEIANEIKSDHHELNHLGVPHYLKAEGWLYFRGVPNVQITEEGIEHVESNIAQNSY